MGLLSISFLSWNSRALLGNFCNAHYKSRTIHPHITRAHVICLQETHGTEHDAAVFAKRYSDSHWYDYSAGTSTAVGGVLTLVSRLFAAESRSHVEVIPGRILLTSLRAPSTTLHILNVHNERLSHAQCAQVKTIVSPLITAAVSEPHCVSLVALGDFNFDQVGTMHVLESGVSGGERRCTQTNESFWWELFSPLLEICQDLPTRASGNSSSVIDRCWASVPSTFMKLSRASVRTLWHPLSKSEISDHSPICLSVSVALGSPRKRPFPAWIAQTRDYQLRIKDALDELGLHWCPVLDPVQRWRAHKAAIHKCAKASLQQALDAKNKNQKVKLTIYSSLCRAVWRNDISLFAKCVRHLPGVCQHAALTKILSDMEVAGRSSFHYAVRFLDYQAFHVVYTSLQTQLLQGDVQELSCPGAGNLRNSRAMILHTWMEGWKPFGRRLIVNGVATQDGVARNPDEMDSALHNYWKSIFQHPPASSVGRAELLKHQFSLENSPPPNALMADDKIRKYAKAKSAPGPDGLAYSFWSASPGHTAAMMLDMVFFLAGGNAPPETFNNSFCVFPAKKVIAGENEIVRSPEATRPLGLKNTDNKLVAALGIWPISCQLSAKANPSQRGFVPGRKFTENIILADAYARAASFEAVRDGTLTADNAATLGGYDVKSAFALLDHSYMLDALKATNAPSGCQLFIAGLYRDCFVVAQSQLGLVTRFQILSGVIQGCPASGTLFVLSLDPFLTSTQVKLKKGEMLAACADDMLSVTLAVSSLQLVAGAFYSLQKVSNLELSIAKCSLCPLTMCPTDIATNAFRQFLRTRVPFFGDCQISYDFIYLGCEIGPRSGAARWKKQFEKRNERLSILTGSERCGSLLVPAYNSHVITTLAYVSQLFSFPSDFGGKEYFALHRLTHLIPGTLPLAAFAQLRALGLPACILMRPFCLATLGRAHDITMVDVFEVADGVVRGRSGSICPESFFASLVPDARNPRFGKGWWDTFPLCREYLRMCDDLCKQHKLKEPIPSFNSQRQAYRFFLELLYPFDWVGFINARLRLSFPCISNPSVLCSSYFCFIGKCFSAAPKAHVYSWIRLLLNSLPTARRLHDGLDARCPFCGKAEVTLTHVHTCMVFDLSFQLSSDSAENPDLPWSDNDLPVPLSASDYDEGIFDESSVVWPLLCKAFYSTPLLSFGDAIREDMKLAFGSARLSVAELGAFLRLTRVEADRQLIILRRLALDGDFPECVACRFPTMFVLDNISADKRRK